jgi:hypothetical protein
MSETVYAAAGSSDFMDDPLAALNRYNSAAARPFAEASHIAGLAAERLSRGATLSAEDRLAVASMLLDLLELGHAGFLKRSGSEADYQAIGAAVKQRLVGPDGQWRA